MVIPDIFNRESILVLFLMDPHYQLAGEDDRCAFDFDHMLNFI